MNLLFRYAAVGAFFLTCLIACNKTIAPATVSENDLVGVWRSEDYLHPIIFTIQPDLSYTLVMEKTDNISLSSIGSTNMMLGMVAVHPTGHIELNSPKITFVVKQDDGSLYIEGSIVSASDSEIKCVLGDSKNATMKLIKQES